MRISYLIAALGLVGCGDDGGTTVDATVVPAMVTVVGTTSEIGIGGRTPIGGVTIEAYEEGGTTPVAMTTSAADGTYTLTITTNGEALDGYLLGKLAGKKDTYLYPAGPLTADISGATVLLLTQQVFDTASTLAQGGQTDGMGFIGIQVYDGANMGVGDVMLSSSPSGNVRYNGSNGLPNSSGTMTMTDGLGYIFNVPAGRVTLMATGGGMTFKSHTITARADQVTTTLITP
jgi:hypothetical protein